MAKIKDKKETFKLTSILGDMKYKKVHNSWDVTFEVPDDQLESVKPLMDHMQDHFELTLVKVDKTKKDEKLKL